MGNAIRINVATGESAVIAVDPPAPIIPEAISMRQARLALLGAGLLSQVDVIIGGLPSPDREAATISWEYATEVRRDSSIVAMLGAALGLADAQIDALFVAATAL